MCSEVIAPAGNAGTFILRTDPAAVAVALEGRQRSGPLSVSEVPEGTGEGEDPGCGFRKPTSLVAVIAMIGALLVALTTSAPAGAAANKLVTVQDVSTKMRCRAPRPSWARSTPTKTSV